MIQSKEKKTHRASIQFMGSRVTKQTGCMYSENMQYGTQGLESQVLVIIVIHAQVSGTLELLEIVRPCAIYSPGRYQRVL